jgi:hypothetical protein
LQDGKWLVSAVLLFLLVDQSRRFSVVDLSKLYLADGFRRREKVARTLYAFASVTALVLCWSMSDATLDWKFQSGMKIGLSPPPEPVVAFAAFVAGLSFNKWRKLGAIPVWPLVAVVTAVAAIAISFSLVVGHITPFLLWLGKIFQILGPAPVVTVGMRTGLLGFLNSAISPILIFSGFFVFGALVRKWHSGQGLLAAGPRAEVVPIETGREPSSNADCAFR